MIFYLTTGEYTWLARAGVPLFVNYRRMWRQEEERKSEFRPALARWALDSGGFTELSTNGKWTIHSVRYANSIRRYMREIGNLDWCAPQDWMCEDAILKKTGLTVAIHQQRTIESYLDLKAMIPEAPIVPVLQGWLRAHYMDHIEQYDRVGIDLRKEPVVCMGTMCRRQDTMRASWIVREMAEMGLRCHALGAKTSGLPGYYNLIASADSLAWSYSALKKHFRYSHLCEHKVKRPGGPVMCNNCFNWAMAWRESDVLGSLPREDEPMPQADVDSLTKGSRARAEAGGDLLAPFDARYL